MFEDAVRGRAELVGRIPRLLALAERAGAGVSEIPGLPADPEAQMAALVEARSAVARAREVLDYADAQLCARLTRVVGCGLAAVDATEERQATPRRTEAIGQASAMLALASGQAPGAVRRRVDAAVRMAEDTPQVAAAYQSGLLSGARARLLAGLLADLAPTVHQRVLDGLVSEDSLTLSAPHFRRRAEALIVEVDPQEASARAGRARAARFASHPRPTRDGMARMSLNLPLVDARILDVTLNAAAAHAHRQGDPRSIPQLRADAVVALAQGARAAGAIGTASTGDVSSDAAPSTPYLRLAQSRAAVNVTLPSWLLIRAHHILTRQAAGQAQGQGDPIDSGPRLAAHSGDLPAWLLELSVRAARDLPTEAADLPPEDRAAHLRGGASLDPATALALAAGGTWRSILVDVHGGVLNIGHSRHDPPPTLATLIRERDQTCVFPGCAVPADECHLDHTIPWQTGGTTSITNLACLCPTHHDLKHSHGWTLTQNTPGTLTWRDPTGHTHHPTTKHTPPTHHTPNDETPPY